MSRFLRHLPCPKCGSRDNLGEWEDGHQYCFGCGYYLRATNHLSRMVDTNSLESGTFAPEGSKQPRDVASGYFDCPRDARENIGEVGLSWLGKYGLDSSDAYSLGLLWSEDKQQLIFPMRKDGMMVGWQARNFRPDKPKYFTKIKDQYKDTLVVAKYRSGEKGRILVLVEDVLSMWKIYQTGYSSICLLGCHLHKQHKDEIIRSFAQYVIVWLDSNKYDVAQKISNTINLLGKSSNAIFTINDPKEYSRSSIDFSIECCLRGMRNEQSTD